MNDHLPRHDGWYNEHGVNPPTDLENRRQLRQRRQAYERTAEQWTFARGCGFGVVIGAAMWTAGIVFVWWVLT